MPSHGSAHKIGGGIAAEGGDKGQEDIEAIMLHIRQQHKGGEHGGNHQPAQIAGAQLPHGHVLVAGKGHGKLNHREQEQSRKPCHQIQVKVDPKGHGKGPHHAGDQHHPVAQIVRFAQQLIGRNGTQHPRRRRDTHCGTKQQHSQQQGYPHNCHQYPVCHHTPPYLRLRCW